MPPEMAPELSPEAAKPDLQYLTHLNQLHSRCEGVSEEASA